MPGKIRETDQERVKEERKEVSSGGKVKEGGRGGGY